MTNSSKPVYLLSDLVEQLESEIDSYKISTSEALARAYDAGADMQLDRDARWLDGHALFSSHLTITPSGDALRKAMLSKPSSLKELALALLDKAENPRWDVNDFSIVRSALNQLPD